jgi:uroporphyrinogen decarboxylase
MGNLDPLLMTIGGDVLAAEARRIVEEMRGYPHIFNLGHGITPDADPRHVETLLAAVRG